MKISDFIKNILKENIKSQSNISNLKKHTTLAIVKKYINFSESFNGKICEIKLSNKNTITYSYQRHDLQVNCDSWLKYLYNINENNSCGTFFSCCMASISTLIIVLKNFCKNAVFSNLPYFEAFDFCEKYGINCIEYKNFNNKEKVDFLWLCSASPNFLSINYKLIKTNIIVFDTSCLSPTDKYIVELYNYCKNTDKTLILVRSHMKIDCFGLEINRLGSIVIFNDKNNILNECKELRIALGNNTTLNNIYPWLGNNDFFELINENVLKVQAIMRDVKKYLQKNLDANKYEVCPFDHNLYCTIKIKNKVNNLDELNKNTSLYAQKFDLPVVTASSFFIEKIGIDNFVRRLDNNSQFLRISLSMWVNKTKTMKSIKRIVEYLNNL